MFQELMRLGDIRFDSREAATVKAAVLARQHKIVGLAILVHGSSDMRVNECIILVYVRWCPFCGKDKKRVDCLALLPGPSSRSLMNLGLWKERPTCGQPCRDIGAIPLLTKKHQYISFCTFPSKGR